jgi:hypothetical protein
MPDLEMSTIHCWQHKRLYTQQLIGISSFEKLALFGVPPVTASIESIDYEEGAEDEKNQTGSKSRVCWDFGRESKGIRPYA